MLHPPQGVQTGSVRSGLFYTNPLINWSALLSTDPAKTLEPANGNQTTETERFRFYIILADAFTQKNVNVSLSFSGTGHIYYNSASIETLNYRLYAKLVKTTNSVNVTDLTTETTILNYSSTYVGQTWTDAGIISGTLTWSGLLNPNEKLLLLIRGTSWSGSSLEYTSIGLISTNFKITATIIS